MQIQLKQDEVVIALKQYIAQKGIDLKGKVVTITFLAGRKGSGLTADMTIEDFDIPGFTGAESDASTLSLVGATPPVIKAEGEEQPVISDPSPEGDKPKSVSLFN